MQRLMNSRSDFLLPREKKGEACESLKQHLGPIAAHITSLEDALALVSFEITEDEDGNVDDLFLATDYLDPDDAQAIQAIAPFVRPGSYVMFVGEDAEQWAFVFREHPDTGRTAAFEETVLPILESEYERLRAGSGLRPAKLFPVAVAVPEGDDDAECDGP